MDVEGKGMHAVAEGIPGIELRMVDCMELMKGLGDGTVDLVLCDLPYGVLNRGNDSAKWDSVLPADELWREYGRVLAPGGCAVLFGQGMFTARMMLSNPGWWRYNLVWKKGNRARGFLNARRQPLRNHEDIMVFARGATVYNPQMTEGPKSHGRGGGPHKGTQRCYGKFAEVEGDYGGLKFPKSVLDFDREHPQVHPTQKPVALLEYLVRTYTDEGMTVLDNCMGSGSTGVACVRAGRRFVGFELDAGYFAIASERISSAYAELQGRLF